ncbi:MAG: YdeI/OmpD-associated family protein [Bacteroidota bacterium]
MRKALGDPVTFKTFEDPNPLGVEMPEILQVLIEQDREAKTTFDRLTDGKKRSLIYSIKNVKDIDRQVQKVLAFLREKSVKPADKQ